MKTTAALITVLVSSNSLAANDYELALGYQQALEARHLNGDANLAARRAQEALAKAPRENRFTDALSQIAYEGEGQDVPQEIKEKIKFLTGSKRETYCRGYGLVHMDATHDNGTKSSLRMHDASITGETDEFAERSQGSWTFKLTNGYRKETASNLSLISGNSNSYEIIETRRFPDGKVDSGIYKYRFSEGNTNFSFRTRGNVLEPWPMYMALDFQTWGSPDLGLKLKFEEGYKDKDEYRESGNGYNVWLQSEREVGKHIPEFSFSDKDGGIHNFSDCFPVDVKITFLRAARRSTERK